MEDRFKFRCFWEDDKQMYYCDDYCMPKLSKGEENIAHIMQCTGLKDINGKLIYEGDIVEFIDFIKEERKGVIIFDDRCAVFFVEKIIKLHRLTEFVNVNRYDLKILGNIYENPELLESEGK